MALNYTHRRAGPSRRRKTKQNDAKKRTTTTTTTTTTRQYSLNMNEGFLTSFRVLYNVT